MKPDLDHDWLKTSLAMIMTMRADDAQYWDINKLVDFAKSFSLGAFGFSVGGITAFYPTSIQGHTRSPSLGERDLVKDTIEALHATGIRAIGRIDPSLASGDQLRQYPDRFARDINGEPIRLHDFFLTCPTGDHFNSFMLEVVQEIVERYPLDGLWANAAQFSPWGTSRCFCDNCKLQFKQESGFDFPKENWNDPAWRAYNEWRYKTIAKWNSKVHSIITAVRPPCAWLPLSQVVESWDHTRKGGWDVDLTSLHADGVVLEAQRRYCNLWWPGMESRYAHAMNAERGAGITISYFYPWWRFTHAPVAENRVWAAQIVANGARPWLHVTGYFSEYFDSRGISAMRDLFELFHCHSDIYAGRHSAAEVALVYSRINLDYTGGADPDINYLDGFRGAYNALLDARIPFDLISDTRLNADKLRRYNTILLPNLACMSDETAAELSQFMERGGHIVATYRTGFCDIHGEQRNIPIIEEFTGARYTGKCSYGQKAAYAYIGVSDHPVLSGVYDTDLLPLAGSVCHFEPGGASDEEVLLFIPPVEASEGSGMSVPEFNAAVAPTKVPLFLTRSIGAGSIWYFPWEPDRIGFHYGLRDPMRLIASAVRAGQKDGDLITIEGVGFIDVSVMDKEESRVVHIVNFNSAAGIRSGNRRAIEEIVPLHGLSIRLKLPESTKCKSVRAVIANDDLRFLQEGRFIRFELPVLEEFESMVISLSSNEQH